VTEHNEVEKEHHRHMKLIKKVKTNPKTFFKGRKFYPGKSSKRCKEIRGCDLMALATISITASHRMELMLAIQYLSKKILG